MIQNYKTVSYIPPQLHITRHLSVPSIVTPRRIVLTEIIKFLLDLKKFGTDILYATYELQAAAFTRTPVNISSVASRSAFTEFSNRFFRGPTVLKVEVSNMIVIIRFDYSLY